MVNERRAADQTWSCGISLLELKCHLKRLIHLITEVVGKMTDDPQNVLLTNHVKIEALYDGRPVEPG